MKIKNNGKVIYKITIRRKYKDEPFCWRKCVIPFQQNHHKLSYDKGGYDVQSMLVPMACQIHWLWWSFCIETIPEMLGKSRLVEPTK